MKSFHLDSNQIILIEEEKVDKYQFILPFTTKKKSVFY